MKPINAIRIVTFVLGLVILISRQDAHADLTDPKFTLQNLRSNSSKEREEAIRQFKFLVVNKRFSNKGMDPQIKSMLQDIVDQDADEDVRVQALIALIRMQDPMTAPSFEKWAISGKSRESRLFAIRGLAQIKGIAAKPVLKRLFQQDPDIFVRFKAGQELGSLDDASAYDFAMEKLADQDEVIRSQAAETLGAIGKPEAQLKLKQLISVNDGSSVSALEALNSIKLRQFQSSAERLNFLNKALHTTDASCGWAAKTLGMIKTKEAIQVLVDASRTGPKYGTVDYDAKSCAEPILKSLYWDGTSAGALKIQTMLQTGLITELPN